MGNVLANARKIALVGAVIAAGAMWADTFRKSAASNEWAGSLWGERRQTAGEVVASRGRERETTEEREKREKRLLLETGLGEAVRGAKRDVLGQADKLRGDQVRAQRPYMPWSYDNMAPRDVCLQQQLDFPDRFGDLDCMSPAYDGEPPPAPRPQGASDEADAGAEGLR